VLRKVSVSIDFLLELHPVKVNISTDAIRTAVIFVRIIVPLRNY